MFGPRVFILRVKFSLRLGLIDPFFTVMGFLIFWVLLLVSIGLLQKTAGSQVTPPSVFELSSFPNFF